LAASERGRLAIVRTMFLAKQRDIDKFKQISFTYDHRLQRTGDPVRSPLHKLQIGRLVVEWVTISEYLLLYVFAFSLFFFGTQSIATSE
jgi:hypothetical protein